MEHTVMAFAPLPRPPSGRPAANTPRACGRTLLITAAIVLLLLPVTARAAHDGLINGRTSDTLTCFDSFSVSLHTESNGAKVNLRIYDDLNANGIVDPGEPVLMRSRLVEGSYLDSDQVANSFYAEDVDGMNFIGRFVITFEDGGVSCFVGLLVLPVVSGYSIAGTITDPESTPGIMVVASPVDSSGNQEMGLMAASDPAGRYFFGVPDSLADRDWAVTVMDWGAAAPGRYGPWQRVVYIGGHEDSVDLALDSADFFVSGSLLDEHGSPMPDSLPVMGVAVTLPGSEFWLSCSRTSSGSHYRLPVKRDSATFCIVIPQINGLESDYLQPHSRDTMARDSVTGFDITYYHADTTIRGHIFKDGLPANRIELSADGDCGSASCGSYADGRYVMQVSGQCPSYELTITNMPAGYYALESLVVAAPGDTGKDLHLVHTGAEESKPGAALPEIVLPPISSPSRPPVRISYQVPARAGSRIAIYNSNGRLVAAQPLAACRGAEKGASSHYVWNACDRDGRLLPAGIYFVRLEAGPNRTASRKLVLTR
jgi:hypothetical protein